MNKQRIDTPFWQFFLSHSQRNNGIALLFVVESIGSSPGRQGFKMVITEDGQMTGTIGGGMMEQKLSKLAQNQLKNKIDTPQLIAQFHDKTHAKNQSGMICSGEQHIVILALFGEQLLEWQDKISSYLNGQNWCIELSPETAHLVPKERTQPYTWKYESQTKWIFEYSLGHLPRLHIIGGGHVGLALSEAMKPLDFYTTIYDNREGLNTMAANHFVEEKIVVPYSSLGQIIKGGEEEYIVIVTFGYQTDKEALLALLPHKYKFLGMMGSQTKIDTLWHELSASGISQNELDKVQAPIGLPIASKTAQEIAISIAAQLIAIKNNTI